MAEYVVNGAQLECTLGVAPSVLTVLPQHRAQLTGEFQANISDCIGFVNIAPFGACTVTSPPKPCTPACPIWIGGKADLLLDGLPALLDTDTAVCAAGGGMVSITDSGQGDAKQRLIDLYEAEHPDHKDILDEFLKDVIADGNYDEAVKDIKYLMYFAKEPYKTLMFEYLPNIDIASYTDTNQRHSAGLLYITLDPPKGGASDPRGPYVTFFHELGHGIDYQMTQAGVFDQSNSGLHDILSNDTFSGIEDATRNFTSDPAAISAVVDSFRNGGTPITPGSPEEAIRNMVIDEYRNNLDVVNNPTRVNQITDILGGYTNNDLGRNLASGTYGHDDSYWTDTSRTKEFFAHNFSNNVTRNAEKVDLMKTYYPGGRDFLDTSLTEVAKNLGNGGSP